ncbi:MAG TPA: tRNA pseudouridine(38-40) synthase TruA [Tepidisphaeraceae bacterium]|jgi:tRNA pseudouridine38-40 synthase
MQRYKLLISYRGTRYHGWQQQAANQFYKGPPPPPGHGIPTIQETVTRTIQKIIGHPITLIGSSRTDTGVHAKGQVAHFDTDQTQIPLIPLRRAINYRLPDDILIREITPVPNTFDAIESTISKRYQYVIWSAENRPPLFADLVWHRWRPLNIAAMREAAAHFLGTHDFASFARPCHIKETTIRTIHSCEISYRPPRLVIGIEGSGFLWNMVRIIVGTLFEIGLEKYWPSDIPKMLAAADRRSAGSTAPPQGLYLQWIKYRESNQ